MNRLTRAAGGHPWIATMACAIGLTMALPPHLASASGGSVPTATAQAVQSGVDFKFELFPTSIVVGEPVYLRLKIDNTSGMLAVGNYSGRLYLAEGNDVDVRVQLPGQLPQRYAGPEEAGLYAGTEINLDRDGLHQQDFLLFYERAAAGGLLFDTPGEYVVTARLQGSVYRERPREIVVLPPTKITVRPPANDQEKRAFDTVNQKDLAKTLHMAITSEEDQLLKLRAFVGNFPNSPWTPQAMSVLANNLLYGTSPNRQAAGRMFMDIATRFPDSPRASSSLFAAVAAYSGMGDKDTARALYWLLRDLYPGYPLIRKENAIANEFEFGPLDFLGSRPWFHYNRPYSLTPQDKTVNVNLNE